MTKHHPLVVGLTGGIGSGKSTIADMFSALGTPIIDADEIAHGLVAPGKPALKKIITAFGPDCVDARGQLDRGKLRKRVFSDPAQRQQLEAILHPIIRLNIRTLLNSIQTPYCIVVIPLLLETGQSDLVDRILVIDTPLETRISRVELRDDLSREEINAIIGTQVDRKTRLAAADDIIINNGRLDELTRIVQAQHKKYLKMARGQPD